MAPTQLGFTRNGTDIDVYNKNLPTYFKQFAPDVTVTVPSFTTALLVPYSNGKTLYTNMFAGLTAKVDKTKYTSVHTRDDYAANMQTAVQNALRKVVSMTPAQQSYLFSYVSDNILKLYVYLGTDGTLYGVVKEAFDNMKLKYDDASLRSTCASLQSILYSTRENDGNWYFNVYSLSKNINYISAMHCEELVYALLKNY